MPISSRRSSFAHYVLALAAASLIPLMIGACTARRSTSGGQPLRPPPERLLSFENSTIEPVTIFLDERGSRWFVGYVLPGQRANLRVPPSSSNPAGREFILVKTPDVTIIDARAAMFYDGPPHGEHRAGHVPSAVNLPFNTVFGDDLRLLSADSLATLFRNAGVKPSSNVIVYCHIGQQATAVIFAARSLGYNARLYDGSFDDWSARKALPVEGGDLGQHRGSRQ